MITITQSPQDFYPAYNDSYLKFYTDFSEDDRAIIRVLGTFYQFTIYPDSIGEYLFNLKNIITSLIDTNKFRDTTLPQGMGYSDPTLYKELDIEITVQGDGTSEVSTKTYKFIKAVKQFGDTYTNNPYQLLMPGVDSYNYKLTYFEGYPMDFTIKYPTIGESITLQNKRTEEISSMFTPGSTNPYRLVLDTGVNNLQSMEILSMPDIVNTVDVRVNEVVKASIEIKKVNNQSGVYLKWFNADGAYSYWLFNQWYTEEYNSSELDRIATNNFNNIYGNSQGDTTISGKEGAKSMKVKTKVEQSDYEHLKSIITSPMVQMWSENTPYKPGKWVDVKVSTKKLNYNNKKHINQVDIEIELPGVNTQTL